MCAYNMYMYVYVYICMYIYTYMYTYLYIYMYHTHQWVISYISSRHITHINASCHTHMQGFAPLFKMGVSFVGFWLAVCVVFPCLMVAGTCVLQRAICACCSVLQCVVVCCNALWRGTMCCSVLCCMCRISMLDDCEYVCVAVRCSTPQCVSMCRSLLQCVAVRCSLLQCTAACCSVL